MIMKNQLLNLKMIALMCLMMVLGGANVWAEEEVISLAKGSYANAQITWTGNSCSIIQGDGNTSLGVNGSYIGEPRWYKNHVVSFNANKGYKIDGASITCTTKDYASALKNSTYTNAKATYSGKVVTITASGDFTVTLGAQSRISKITIKYSKDIPTTPTLSISDNSLDFGANECNTNIAKKFTLSGVCLTASASLTLAGSNPEMFSVSPTSIAQTDGTIAETDVTVSYSPTSIGSHTATLTISSKGAEDKTISLTGTSANAYNVAWNVNGNVYTDGTPTTKVIDGEKVTVLPTAPSDINGKVFVGWAATEISGESASKPTDLFAIVENAPVVSANTTYYAVFANKVGTEYWKKVTAAKVNSEGEGEYALLTPDGHAFNGIIRNKIGQATADAFVFVSNKSESAPKGTCVLTLKKVGTKGYTMYNAEYGYLYAIDNSAGNLAWNTTEDSYWSYSSSDWLYAKNKAHLRSRDNNTFRTYASTSGQQLVFAKKVSDIAYSNYCTTIGTAAKPTYTEKTLKFIAKNSDGYYATFSSDKVTFFTDACILNTVVVDGGDIVFYDTDYNVFTKATENINGTEVVGYYVPSKTGVLVYTTDENLKYYEVENKTVSALEADVNMLQPAPTNGGVFEATDAYKYYKLAYDDFDNKTGLGFYWGAPEGGKFFVKAGTAYLAVPKVNAAGAKGFTLSGEATGIEGVNANVENAKAIYNLNGQRVASMAKPGLYIVNGKKMVVRK